MLFGDRGYISQKLFEAMMKEGLRIVTALRVKMKPKLMLEIINLLKFTIQTVHMQLN